MISSLKQNKILVLHKEKVENAIEKRKNKIFRKTKSRVVFLMSQGSINLKKGFLGQKVCSVARLRTHTRK